MPRTASKAPVACHSASRRSDSVAPIHGNQPRDTSNRRASGASVNGPPK